MMKLAQKTIKALLVTACCLILVACGSKINQANFEKVHQGMTMDEVTAILGSPSNTASVSFGNMSGTAATWKQHDTQIDIQFFNNQVKIKNFVKGKELNDDSDEDEQ